MPNSLMTWGKTHLVSMAVSYTTTTTRGVYPKRAHCFVASLFSMDLSEQPRTGAVQRRKQRRLRSWWRHEQQSIAAALATSLHHSSRGQRKARAREEESELKYTAKFQTTPPLQLVLFSLYDEEPGGWRPASLALPPGPQERVPQHRGAHARDVRARPVSRCSCAADG